MFAFLFKRHSVRSGERKQTTRLELQSLEGREVPASLFTPDGHLQITGTEGDDNIRIRVEGDRLQVMFGDRFDPIQRSGRLYDALIVSRVRRITINGLNSSQAERQ